MKDILKILESNFFFVAHDENQTEYGEKEIITLYKKKVKYFPDDGDNYLCARVETRELFNRKTEKFEDKDQCKIIIFHSTNAKLDLNEGENNFHTKEYLQGMQFLFKKTTDLKRFLTSIY